MPNIIWFGLFKNDQITNGASLAFGQSVMQNRTAVKQNNGSIGIGDGLILAPIAGLLNQDSDLNDNMSADAQDFNNSPQV